MRLSIMRLSSCFFSPCFFLFFLRSSSVIRKVVGSKKRPNKTQIMFCFSISFESSCGCEGGDGEDDDGLKSDFCFSLYRREKKKKRRRRRRTLSQSLFVSPLPRNARRQRTRGRLLFAFPPFSNPKTHNVGPRSSRRGCRDARQVARGPGADRRCAGEREREEKKRREEEKAAAAAVEKRAHFSALRAPFPRLARPPTASPD